MSTLIHERVELAKSGDNPTVIAKMESGWAVIGDVQFVQGYCLLLPDPVVSSLNDLTGKQRTQYLDDMARLGDAVLQTTGCLRINYEILGNVEPALHAHIFPRYENEPKDLRHKPVWFYDWENAPKFNATEHKDLMQQIKERLIRTI